MQHDGKVIKQDKCICHRRHGHVARTHFEDKDNTLNNVAKTFVLQTSATIMLLWLANGDATDRRTAATDPFF